VTSAEARGLLRFFQNAICEIRTDFMNLIKVPLGELSATARCKIKDIGYNRISFLCLDLKISAKKKTFFSKQNGKPRFNAVNTA